MTPLVRDRRTGGHLMSAVQKSRSSSSVLRAAEVVTPAGCLGVGALGLVLALVLPVPWWLGVLWLVLWCVLGLVLRFTRESRRIDEIFAAELSREPMTSPGPTGTKTPAASTDSLSNPRPSAAGGRPPPQDPRAGDEDEGERPAPAAGA